MLKFQFCLDRINRIYKIVFKQASPVLHAKILLILLILSKTFLPRAAEEVRRRASDDRRE